jgi:hypothetical protein
MYSITRVTFLFSLLLAVNCELLDDEDVTPPLPSATSLIAGGQGATVSQGGAINVDSPVRTLFL